MDPSILSNISLLQFYTESLKQMDSNTAAGMTRHMQKGVFEILWQRFRGKDTVVNTYKSIGHACEVVTSNQSPTSVVFFRIKNKSVTGVIRNPISYHHDFRFVSLVHNDNAYILLENTAIDAKLALVWKYDKNIDAFVPTNLNFLEFLLQQKIIIPTAECEKTVVN